MVPSKDQPLAQLHVRQRPRRRPGRWRQRIEQWRWRRVAIGDRVRHPRRPHTGHPRPQVAPRRVTVRCNLAMPGCVCDGVVAEAPVSDYDIDRGPEFDTSTPVSSLTLRLAVTDGVAFLTEEFTVRISTTDGDDQTIQTTGTIQLIPTPWRPTDSPQITWYGRTQPQGGRHVLDSTKDQTTEEPRIRFRLQRSAPGRLGHHVRTAQPCELRSPVVPA